MTPHLDKYKRLKKLSGIPKLWNVKATPVTDQLNSEPLIVSDIQYKTGENNIPLVVADSLNFDTTEIYTATAYYPKSWLYSTLWHLYEKKYSTLLNNFFKLVFYEEAITRIDFQFSGEWHVATTAELTLGHNTYQANGEGIDTIINLLKTQIDLTDNTVKTSINEEHTLTINIGARLPQIYNIQTKVISPTHLEAINFTTQYQQVEKKIQAHATDITTSLNNVLVNSDDYITLGHTIKMISAVLNAPPVQLDDDSEQDLILGLGVAPPEYGKQCLAAPSYYNHQQNCYFALFLVQLKTLISPNLESFIEPTEFRDHLIYRLSDEEYTECDLKSLLGLTQIGERAYPLYRGKHPEYDIEFLNDYYAVDGFMRNRNWPDSYNEYFGEDTDIFPNYVDLDFTVNEESNNNRWLIESDPLYGIYGTHISRTTTIKSFRIYLNNLNLTLETLPSAGQHALRYKENYDEYSLTDFSWTDYAILQGQIYPSRQLNSAPFVELNWNPHHDSNAEYLLQLDNQTVEYLLPYHQYKNTHWHSAVSQYLQDTEDEDFAWRIAQFELKHNNATIYQTEYAYFFDGYTGLSEFDPITQTPEEAFEWHINQNNHMFFLAIPHDINSNETIIQPVTRITKETFLREYPVALGRTATIIDTNIENAICYVYVGWWRNQVHQKCVSAYQLLNNLLPTDLLNTDFINIINDLEHIYEQDFDMSYLEGQFWKDFYRQPQYTAFQAEIEAERTRRIELIPVWRENNDWGTNNDKGISIVAEFSRTQPWNTITSGYPSLAYIAAGYAISGDERAIMFPRAKNNENTDLTGTAATAFMATEGAIGNSLISGIPSGPNSKIYDNEGNKYAPFLPIMLMDKDKYSYRVGEISTICDIWLPPRSLLANKELISKNSQEYIALQTYSTTHMLLFPHG
jgi:hypothetical protein